MLCREEARRTDPCIDVGLSWKTSDGCNAAVSKCRTEVDASSAAVACATAPTGRPGTCAVTVENYLACVDAWNAVQQCSRAGLRIETPDACQDLVTTCSRFAGQFFRNGTLPTCPDSGGAPPPASDDVYGFDGCGPAPARFVALGDSIASCFGATTCSPNLIADHLRASIAPDLRFESHAVAGSHSADLVEQAAMVAGGPGHVLVWIFCVGNDLLGGATDPAPLAGYWKQTFDYFTDRDRFPDGATFLLNTQYNPYDECNPGGTLKGITPAESARVLSFNKALFLDVARERTDAVAVDNYPSWLGHGHNANIEGCHCTTDNTSWMADDIHPNDLGHEHIAAEWDAVLDRMYGSACHDR